MLRWLHNKLERYCVKTVAHFHVHRYKTVVWLDPDPTKTWKFKTAAWLEFKLRKLLY